MPKTRQQKEEQVKILSEKLSRAKSVVFADYRGLNMSQFSHLRKLLREQNAELTVTKNTLLQRAMKEIASSPTAPRNDVIARDAPDSASRGNLIHEGPTATLLAFDDEISPIKILANTLKEAAIGKIKSGFLGTQFLDEANILKLASLPGKDELRAQTVGVLSAPLQGMVSVLQGNLRNLVYALSEIQKARGGE